MAEHAIEEIVDAIRAEIAACEQVGNTERAKGAHAALVELGVEKKETAAKKAAPETTSKA